MSRKFRVAVIGGRPAPIAGAKELGIDVVLVHEKGAYDEAIAVHTERIVHVASIADGPAILQVLRPLHEERPFDRVITTTEPAAESTGHVVDALGLPGVSEHTARALKDKALTRELLAKHDLSPVKYRMVHGPEEAAEFLAEVGGPIVLKPVDGVASLHIHCIADADEIPAAWAAFQAAGIAAPIAEEFLEGPVVSVDSISYGGRHVPIGYSEYRMNDRFVEWEVSTPSRVAVPWLTELRELTPRLLDAVGLTEGPSHSEFVLTPNGPRVLESHARLAGSGAPELVRRAFGHDLNRYFLTVPLGIDTIPETSPDPIGGAAVRFFTPDPGTVRSVEVEEDLAITVRQLPKGEVPLVFLPYLDELRGDEVAVVIQKSPGDEVPPLLTVADCTSGYVIATGLDADDAVAKCDAINERIHFHVG
ncbi:ATP-grasp domain-containing protein [Streptomyces sp. UNOC14_S4]|uniref:ATP-grasp domain-containing protein n=1 Tax=Streptomyces sp. UNOC14_S4 TaxID=2872340 RepID=UPI001E29E4A6|nr:ATP-grasp domain-containing protein [Streptomyces sp. UNOC14_S4]MCC3767824.1 ATP-grasp domain-containing protein [Streptomyces sp. UNOC14_S4]